MSPVKGLNLSELQSARSSKAARTPELDASRSQLRSRELAQARALASWFFFRITVSRLKMLLKLYVTVCLCCIPKAIFFHHKL